MNNLADIIPEKLDMVMRDNDFVIYYDGTPLLTPGGHEFSGNNARILKHLLVKITLNRGIPNAKLSSSTIFLYLKDHIETGFDFVKENFDRLFDMDVVVKARYGEKNVKLLDPSRSIDFMEKYPDVFNLVFWSNSAIMEGFRTLLDMIGHEPEKPYRETDGKVNIQTLLLNKYLSLSDVQRAIVNLLSLHHQNGIVLPLMLVMKVVSCSEYANSTLAMQTNIKENIPVDENLKQNVPAPLKVNWENPLEYISQVHRETLKALEFLSFFGTGSTKISVIRELINMGENDSLEFKSTFRWDIRQDKKNPAIEHASLKTMAAFLNSEGGDLLIGVEDDGNILGIETDGFPNDDKFLLHLWGLIKTSMGQDVSPYIKTTLEKFDGKTVCRVHCLKSPKPIFLRQKGFDESFYIRIGPSTGSLEISEALKYIGEHFR